MLFEAGTGNRFCRFARSDSDSVNGSPPEAFGGLPLDLDSPLIRCYTKLLKGESVQGIVTVIKMVAVFMAATMLGRWFRDEIKKSAIRKEPWHKPYLSLPGLIILAAMFLLPVLLWIIKSSG